MHSQITHTRGLSPLPLSLEDERDDVHANAERERCARAVAQLSAEDEHGEDEDDACVCSP